MDAFLAFALVSVAAELFAASSPWHLSFNSTASIPRGFYATKALQINEAPVLGQIACFRYFEPAALAGRNYFPAGSALCKPVAAVAGQVVTQDGSGLFVTRENGERIKVAQVAERDRKGRPLPQHFQGRSYRLAAGEYLLVAGAKPNSLDSRFLGVLKREQLFQTARPLLTFE